jgi:hypothetical protein
MDGKLLNSELAGSQTSIATKKVSIKVDDIELIGRFEIDAAPETCSIFASQLPFTKKVIHCRWSGEGIWIPLGSWSAPLTAENQTGNPRPGQILLYAGGPSEPELLIPYGQCLFNSKFGRLHGNHIISIQEPMDQLLTLGQLVLWHGAQDCTIAKI